MLNFHKHPVKLLLCFLLVGALLRFYNLNWGAPYYFHPDERNIASAISGNLQFPTDLNPDFFAYGSLPLYTVYFLGLLFNFFTTCQLNLAACPVTFAQAIIGSRLLSAVFSLLIIFLVYQLGTKLRNQRTGLLAAFCATTSIGLVQFAHFGTVEMWQTLFTLLLFYACLQLPSHLSEKAVFLTGIILGGLISIKVSGVIFTAIPVGVLLFHLGKRWVTKQLTLRQAVLHMLWYGGVLLLTAGLIFVITNPFVVLDYPHFLGSFQYESSVGFGTLPVFYTGEFFETIPVVFQFVHIYPFLLNPLLTFLFLPAIILLCLISWKKRSYSSSLLLLFFAMTFFPQAILFVKWTRYLIPTLPFIYLILALAGDTVWEKVKHQTQERVLRPLFWLSGGICCVWIGAFFITVYVKPDTRVAARNWAKEHIPQQTSLLSEVYDLGITPFNETFPSITLFNFYDLDAGSVESTPETLSSALKTHQYLVLPSQRILKTRLMQPQRFPQGNHFYQALFSGKTAYKLVYQTPCDVLCKIVYLGNPVFAFEQTASVFDRPEVYIFKKQ